VVPIVVILVPLPAAGGPLVAAACAQIAPARPDVTVVPPAVWPLSQTWPRRSTTALVARGRRLVAPGVNDSALLLRRWSASAEIPRLESANAASPNFNSSWCLRLPLLKGRLCDGKPVGASLDERAVIVRNRVDL